MLPTMADKTPPFWPEFIKGYFPPLIGAAMIVVPIWYFFGEEIVTFLRPWLENAR